MKFKKIEMTGVILAGGKNSRFGEEKALVKIGGLRVIDGIINTMSEVFYENIIISNNEKIYKEFGLKIFPDIQEGKGPVMGLYTALLHSSSDIFVTACDMPFINEGVIRKIVSQLAAFDAVIPKYEGKLHFLHAAYSLRCLNVIKKKLETGTPGNQSLRCKPSTSSVQDKRTGYKRGDKFHQSNAASPVPLLTGQAAGELNPQCGIKNLVKDLKCNIIEEFKFEDGCLSPFFNMNTPNDFALAKDHCKRFAR